MGRAACGRLALGSCHPSAASRTISCRKKRFSSTVPLKSSVALTLSAYTTSSVLSIPRRLRRPFRPGVSTRCIICLVCQSHFPYLFERRSYPTIFCPVDGAEVSARPSGFVKGFKGRRRRGLPLPPSLARNSVPASLSCCPMVFEKAANRSPSAASSICSGVKIPDVRYTRVATGWTWTMTLRMLRPVGVVTSSRPVLGQRRWG
mmetsp:Transcript_10289/g.16467  ORF Transcript_10289/g.16467 Transcript_10289/m.16467 type:complete len:204 (+) Transcript_10289:697-1308(+)